MYLLIPSYLLAPLLSVRLPDHTGEMMVMVFLPAWPLFPVYRAHKHLETALDGCLDGAGSEEQAQGCADLVWDQDTADPSLCPECSMHRAWQAVRLIPGILCGELATEHGAEPAQPPSRALGKEDLPLQPCKVHPSTHPAASAHPSTPAWCRPSLFLHSAS